MNFSLSLWSPNGDESKGYSQKNLKISRWKEALRAWLSSTRSFYWVFLQGVAIKLIGKCEEASWWELLKINDAATMMVLRHPLLNPINNNFDAISWCRVLTLLPGFFWLHVMFLFKSSYCRKLYSSSPSKRNWFILSQIVWQNFLGFILAISWGINA